MEDGCFHYNLWNLSLTITTDLNISDNLSTPNATFGQDLRNVLPPFGTARLCYLPEVMVAEGVASFSLSSVVFTGSCCEFSPCSGVVSFNSTAHFAFKHEFTVCGDSCSAISEERRYEFVSSTTLCNVKTLHVVLGSSGVLISFSNEKKRPLCISLSLLFTMNLFPVSIEFDVAFDMLGSSAIVLKVSAGFSALHHGKRGAKKMARSRYMEKKSGNKAIYENSARVHIKW